MSLPFANAILDARSGADEAAVGRSTRPALRKTRMRTGFEDARPYNHNIHFIRPCRFHPCEFHGFPFRSNPCGPFFRSALSIASMPVPSDPIYDM